MLWYTFSPLDREDNIQDPCGQTLLARGVQNHFQCHRLSVHFFCSNETIVYTPLILQAKLNKLHTRTGKNFFKHC